MPEITYIACPYSHPDPAVRRERFDAVNLLVARLIRKGEVVYSPVSHSHAITETGLPAEWEFWREQSLAMLRVCTMMMVYCLPGWDSSAGVRAEALQAQEWGIPIHFHHPEIEAIEQMKLKGDR